MRTPEPARAVAWLGFAGGAITSVWANVQQARLAPHAVPDEVLRWSQSHPAFRPDAPFEPGIGPQLAAGFWPLALLIAVEVMTRVPWPDGRGWRLSRFAGVGLVALGAAIISYDHLHQVLGAWGYDGPSRVVGPLVVDGLMVVSGSALFALARRPAPAVDEVASADLAAEPVVDVAGTPAVELDTGEKRAAAVAEWKAYLHAAPDAGVAPNKEFAETVAARYGYSTRWSYYRRNDAEQELELAEENDVSRTS